MKKKYIILILLVIAISVGLFLIFRQDKYISPLTESGLEVVEKSLTKYSFEQLKTAKIQPSQIKIGKKIKEETDFASYIFIYCIDSKYISKDIKEPTSNASDDDCLPGGKVSGLINIPTKSGKYPVIVMFRGFVPRENFTTGEGTRRTAEEFARSGFITLAPDFLGFGESDAGAVDSIEDRLQTYPTALTLFASVPNLPTALEELNENISTSTAEFESTSEKESEKSVDFEDVKVNIENVGIWGHSNGGHISLSILAILGKSIPTVLWNPVTKPFPYSILYFTDEFEDEGKALRKIVADFEQEYDVFEYSPSKYYGWITAPIQLHQALDDEAVPVRWSDQFANSMEEMDKDIEYFKYPGENHNFNLGKWEQAVERSIEFYLDKFEDNES